jgi:hypothetical protein
MRQTRLTPVFALTVAAALFTVGCTAGDPQPTVTATVSMTAPTPSETRQVDPDPASSAPETPLPDADPPAEAAPFPADRELDTAQASADARLSPVDLRFGVHDGFDRVVVDLAGAGTPGWLGQYVEDPTQQAAGEPVYVLGDAYLQILVRGVVYPTEAGAQPFEGPRTITPASGGVIKEVRYGSEFEGQVEIWIGLTSDQPFRVFSLTDPTRVVIDAQHP